MCSTNLMNDNRLVCTEYSTNCTVAKSQEFSCNIFAYIPPVARIWKSSYLVLAVILIHSRSKSFMNQFQFICSFAVLSRNK